VAGAKTGFAVDTNAVTIIDRSGHRETVPLMSKDAVADRILDRVLAYKRQHAAGSTPPTKSDRAAPSSTA